VFTCAANARCKRHHDFCRAILVCVGLGPDVRHCWWSEEVNEVLIDLRIVGLRWERGLRGRRSGAAHDLTTPQRVDSNGYAEKCKVEKFSVHELAIASCHGGSRGSPSDRASKAGDMEHSKLTYKIR
jgi:hypothetical protein